ncbi:hypothetical protein TeGR_g5262 [Tetraparma gracilis]|uniref:glutamine--fructose-6-phosphate transaminase (isomerizing) n=1 Tax=Tetraparma gracilis TaxID=2962635 RepID=A0ABQ6MPI7_9STRA|nr:hypothetical protein TeGR_g5262 [Tetraparma gracilis]
MLRSLSARLSRRATGFYRSDVSRSGLVSASSLSSTSLASPPPLVSAAPLLPLVLAALAISFHLDESPVPECCGIVGVVSAAPSPNRPASVKAREYLSEGLTVLKNRGYDSAGLCTVGQVRGKDGKVGSGFLVTKKASVGDNADGVDLVDKYSKATASAAVPEGASHSVGIAHTRWATHGGKTDVNSHPHLDSSGDIALVHNGTINNANELRKELKGLGHVFESETDTEVVAKLIGHFLKTKKLSTRDATELALNRCDGSWGLVVLNKKVPDELVVACNGSPLVIGLGQDATFVASETSAFNRYTKEFIAMKDGEIGVVHADGRTLDLSRVQKAPNQKVELSPAPWPHWTIKETFEQPEAISRALGFGGRLTSDRVKLGGLDSNEEKLMSIKNMTLSACGTSLNAAMYGAKLMRDLGSFDGATAMDAAETTARDLNQSAGSGLIVVSQSGETKDVQRVVTNAMDNGYPTISVVNAVGSLIARTTGMGVYLNAGRENAVASTKAFSTQVTVLALIALWFRERRESLGLLTGKKDTNVLRDALMRLPISFGIALQTRDKCKQIASRLVDKEHMFVLGKGYAEPVAYEGALKIKETCYLHAEGYSGGALKHGPFALIEDKTGKFGATPIILIILDDEHKNSMRTAAEEVKARGAEVIIITDKKSLAEGLTREENIIVVPSNGPLTALISTLPLQLLAYELALLRGVNPDTPRNLAKAVTVD